MKLNIKGKLYGELEPFELNGVRYFWDTDSGYSLWKAVRPLDESGCTSYNMVHNGDTFEKLTGYIVELYK